MKNLCGKTALITGGSRGIGKAISIELAKRGASIVLTYVGCDSVAIRAKEDVESYGVSCRAIKSDFCEPNCVAPIAEVADKVDILILNASTQIRKKWEEITPWEFDAQINCNLRASLLIIQQYAPQMVSQKWGRIITIGSVQESKPHPEMLIYSATKAALTLMAKSLALQLAPHNITVNSVAPGVILTDRNREALKDVEYYNTVLEKIPLGYCGQANDCGGIVSFLCSEEARYITGQNIYADGGMGIK